MSEEEKQEQKKRIIKIGIYLAFFVIAFIILKIESLTSNKENNNIKNQNNEIPKVIENIKKLTEDNIEEFVYLTMDDDALTLNFERSGNIEIGEKSYHKEKITYIKKNNDYYQITENSEKLEPLNNFIEFDYDKTFIELSNIKKLLNLSKKPIYENSKIIYEYDLKDVISIYNNYNNTSIVHYGEGKVKLEIYYNDNKLDYFLINLTDLFNKIYERELNQVLYKIKINNVEKEDLSWFDNLIK